MRVLITGSRSIVGRAIARRLTGEHAVTMAGRDDSADIVIDLYDRDSFARIVGPFETFIHCSATFADSSAQGMIDNELSNSLGSIYAGEAAARAGCRHIIYVSTSFAFEHEDNDYFGSYSLSKRHGEENVALLCAERETAFTALRAGPLYDATGESRKHQRFLYHMIDRARGGQEIVIHGKLDPVRNYLFVDDFAAMVARFVTKRVTGTFPCVAPDSHRVSQIAAMAQEVCGRGGAVSFAPDKPDLPRMHIPDCEGTYAAIDYRPETSLRAGITRVCDLLEGA